MLDDSKPDYWFSLAKHDIESADILLKANGYPDIIIYHYHQAIEKLIKGCILKYQGKIPFIHDLNRLYEVLTALSPAYSELKKPIYTLNSFYRDLRYPISDQLGQADLFEAKQSFDTIQPRLLTE